MAVTAETRNAIIELVVTAYNAAPGTTLLTELVEAVDGGASLADVATTLTTSSTFNGLYPTFQTTTEFANELLDNLVPSATTEARAEGVAAIEFVLNSGGTRADVILQAQTFLAGLSTEDPAFGEPASAFQNKVTVATYYTVTLERDGDIDALQNAVSGVDSTEESVTSAQATLDGQSTGGTTSALTDKIDTVSGTTSNDTVNGIVSDTTADVTYNVADSIDLGAGDGDVLNVSIINDNNGVSFAGRTASGVEIVNLKHIDGDASGQTATFNVSSISTPTQVWVKDGTVIGTNDDTVDVQGVSSSATIGLANNDSDLDVTFTTTGSATTGDSITLAVGGGATGGVTINDAAGDGVATVNIATSGSAGSLSSLTSTDLTTVNISGDQKFTSIGLDSDVTTIDASANTAGVTVNANAGSKLKATGSSAADTLSLTVASSVSTGMAVSAFETVSFYASATSTVDMDLFSDVSTIALSSVTGAHGNVLTLQDIGAAPVINAVGAGKSTSTVDANGVTVVLKDATGTSDSVTVNVNNLGVSAGTGDAELGNFTAANVENVTLNTADFDNVTFGQFTVDNAKSITVTGSGDVDFGGLDAAVVETFSAGSATGDLTLGTLDNTGVASTITTGSGKDSLTTSAMTKAHTINTGAGVDTVTVVATGAAGTLDLDTGDDNDTIQIDAAAAVNTGTVKIDGGAGDQDTLRIFGTGDTKTINIDEFDNVERITLEADTAATTVELTVPSGYADTVQVTEVSGQTQTLTFTAPAGGTVSLKNYTFLGWTSGTDVINLNGSTGAETLTGSSVVDQIDGGTGADTINGGSGNDIINQTSGDTVDWTAPTGTSVSTTGMDIMTLAAGDIIDISDYGIASADILAAGALDSDAEVTGNDLSAVTDAPENSINVQRGTYDSSANSFTESATGSDALLLYDADDATGSIDTEAVVLIGLGANTIGFADGGAAGQITIS